jgi:hypothetical protein
MNTEELKKLFREKYQYVVVDDDVLEQAIEYCKGMAQDEDTLCWLIEDYIVSQGLEEEVVE